MPIQIKCAGCDARFRVKSGKPGAKGKCPKCGNVFQLPAGEENGGSAAKSIRPRTTDKISAETSSASSGSGRSGVALKTAVSLTKSQKSPPPETSPVVDPPPIHEAPADGLSPEPPPLQTSAAGGSSGELRAVKKSSNPLPLYIGLGIGGVVVLLVAIAVVAIALFGGGSDTGQQAAGERPPKRTYSPPIVPADPEGDAAAEIIPISDEQRSFVWSRVRPYVCRVTVQTPEGRVSGAGFLVDARGFVVTSERLIRRAESVDVIFPSPDGTPGESVAALGVVAGDRPQGLVMLELDAPSPASENPALAGDAKLSEGDILASCVPQSAAPWIEASRFVEHAREDKLPPGTKADLRDMRLNDAEGLTWIEHSSPVESEAEGGPLLNLEGEIVGVNVSLGETSRHGYAVPISSVIKMLVGAEDIPALEPFNPPGVAAAGEGDNPLAPDRNPFESTRNPFEAIDGPADTDELPESLSVETLDFLRQQCRKAGWMPGDEREYRVFQAMARMLLEASRFADDPASGSETQRLRIQGALEGVLEEISEVKWGDHDELKEINRLVLEGLAPGSDEQGAYAYGKVLGVIEKGRAADFPDKHVVVLELIGSEETIVLLSNFGKEELPKGSRWLLLGVHRPELLYNISLNDGVLERELQPAFMDAAHLIREPELIEGSGPAVGGGPVAEAPKPVPRSPEELKAASAENLSRIMVAIRNHHEVQDALPPAYLADESGKPLHSWRVLILPYLVTTAEEDEHRREMYRNIRLSEPWDSPYNKQFHSQMPAEFGFPGSNPAAGITNYMIVLGENPVDKKSPTPMLGYLPSVQKGDKPYADDEEMFRDYRSPTTFFHTTDGPARTAYVVEVAGSTANWMEPADLKLADSDQPINARLDGTWISNPWGKGAHFGMGDGEVRWVPATTRPEIIRQMLNSNDDLPKTLPE